MREYCLDPEECAFMGYGADASTSSPTGPAFQPLVLR